ncbi:dihydrolipoyl dehydrogenase [Spartinivicinus poritis]|uniref:Dihydrolipoyl dehydrogenase n=1 Tax=Spartinivicinus poritis TaxID=2994640 RepID=A0ABT5U3R8_9GAMM|nr:dihydrolipoyl dehydrogenase [Spartinivicinus sp. A2-2]MDE1461019.1 dihydrolipoyl dehydrogenase [Spartinivicinus sp. A2-2]
MKQLNVDVAVIGAGTAGLGAYRTAKAHTDNVVLIEGGPYGTTCARVGCMPSKLLIAAAEAVHHIEQAPGFGVKASGEILIDGKAVMQRVRSERDRFAGFVVESVDNIPAADKIRGYARFLDDHRIQVDDHMVITAQRFVIATGSRPSYPAIFAEAGDRLIVNDDVFDWEDLPNSVAVFGPGVIGLELGQALSRLGVNVKLFGIGNLVGPLTDPAVIDYARNHFKQQFPFIADAKLERIERTEQGVSIEYQDDEGNYQQDTFDYLLAATGRTPNIDKLGLENTTLTLSKRGIPEYNRYTLQCGDSHIFIAGDANHELPLLHEAADEGRIAGDNAGQYPTIRSGQRRTPISVVFSDPQLAMVGQTFKQVDQENQTCGCYAVGEVSFEDQGRSRVMLKNKGILRVYGAQGTGLLLGAEMIGPAAEHLAHLLAWVIQQRLTVNEVLALPFYHPVIEEGLRTALRDLNSKLKLGPEMIKHCLDCGPGA